MFRGSLVQRHFGTREFSVLDQEELEEYVEDLIAEGAVEVEPQFFEAETGKNFKIIVKVRAEQSEG